MYKNICPLGLISEGALLGADAMLFFFHERGHTVLVNLSQAYVYKHVEHTKFQHTLSTDTC